MGSWCYWYRRCRRRAMVSMSHVSAFVPIQGGDTASIWGGGVKELVSDTATDVENKSGGKTNERPIVRGTSLRRTKKTCCCCCCCRISDTSYRRRYLPDEVVLVWWRQQPILQYLRSGIYLSQPRALTSELKTCFGILLLAAQRVSAVQRQARGRGHGRLDRFRRPPTLHLSWQDDYGWIAWPQSGFRQSIKARIFTTISR